MAKSRLFAMALLFGLLLCFGSPQKALSDYTYYDLGVLSGSSFAQAWNISGLAVVGRCYTTSPSLSDTVGFLWTPGGGMRSLGTAGGAFSIAYGVNRMADSVGESETADGLQLAFFKEKRGAMVALPYLPSPNPYSRAYAINSLRQIAGFSNNEFSNYKACVWWDPRSTDPPENLGNLTGDPMHNSIAFGINDSSEVVGDSIGTNGQGRPVYWSRARGMVDLGTLGGESGLARAINNKGHVVGSAENLHGYREAFHINVYAARPKMRGLGGLGGTGNFMGYPTISYAQGGNDAPMIVGFAYNAANEQVAFVWTRAGGMQDLNTLVTNLPEGVVLRRACGINAYGYIVGFTADGRAFLLVGRP